MKKKHDSLYKRVVLAEKKVRAGMQRAREFAQKHPDEWRTFGAQEIERRFNTLSSKEASDTSQWTKTLASSSCSSSASMTKRAIRNQDIRNATKVKKTTAKWIKKTSKLGPVKIPGLKNAFYVDLYEDKSSGDEYITGEFPGAYRLAR